MSILNFATTIAPVVEVPVKKRRHAYLNQTPDVQSLTLNRKPTVRVGLSGSDGAGRWMTLDTAVWLEMRAAYGAAWSLVSNGHGRLYVRAKRAVLRDAARQPSGSGVASLARLIMGAERGDAVLFRNGDPLDLRRANLVKLTQADAARWRREQVARIEERKTA